MGNNWFKFKQFTVYQDSAAMRVGTDGVLLGAWAHHPAPLRILDVGSGTGVISLMAAQRWSTAQIDAIDPDLGAFDQSCKNFELSPWSNRLTAHNCDLQHFNAKPYDLIISNPPYFVNSLKNPDSAKSTARHTDTLSFNELTQGVLRLLTAEGRFALILPQPEMALFLTAARGRMFVTRRCEVWSTPTSGVRRIMAELSTTPPAQPPVTEKLIIEDNGPQGYSEEYRALTRDFYLKF